MESLSPCEAKTNTRYDEAQHNVYSDYLCVDKMIIYM